MPKMDDCFCCGDEFEVQQLDDNGHCTMCADAERSFKQDGIPAGRPCCRRRLSKILKENQQR